MSNLTSPTGSGNAPLLHTQDEDSRPLNTQADPSEQPGYKPTLAPTITLSDAKGHAPKRIPLGWLPILIALIAGIGLGVVVMRHRYQSRQVIVAVNGVTITDNQFFSRLKAAAGVPILQAMVQEEMQLQFARSKGLAPTDAQVQARYDKFSVKPGFVQNLAASHQSAESFKRHLQIQMARAAILSQGVSVSDAEIRAFYVQQSDPHNTSALFYQPDIIGLSVIATPTQDIANHALKELNGDTPFGIVASEYSIDPSKANGGALSPLSRGRSPLSRFPAIEQTVFNLKPGERMGPVMFGKRWWIIQCTNKTPAMAVPFDEVKDDCRTGALEEKGRRLNAKRVDAEFQSFEQSANMQVFQKEYQAVLNKAQ